MQKKRWRGQWRKWVFPPLFDPDGPQARSGLKRLHVFSFRFRRRCLAHSLPATSHIIPAYVLTANLLASPTSTCTGTRPLPGRQPAPRAALLFLWSGFLHDPSGSYKTPMRLLLRLAFPELWPLPADPAHNVVRNPQNYPEYFVYEKDG